MTHFTLGLLSGLVAYHVTLSLWRAWIVQRSIRQAQALQDRSQQQMREFVAGLRQVHAEAADRERATGRPRGWCE